MTDTTDYTTKPEVLAACGLTLHEYDDPAENYYTDENGVCRGQRPFLTQQELWDGLCKACEVVFRGAGIHLNYCGGLDSEFTNVQIRIGMRPDGSWNEKFFIVRDYGTFANTIAAALYTVLQQGEKKEG